MTESTIKLEENAKEIISHFQFLSVGSHAPFFKTKASQLYLLFISDTLRDRLQSYYLYFKLLVKKLFHFDFDLLRYICPIYRILFDGFVQIIC
jgi:hypothetical protein